jgi:hypothetical protein
MLAHRDAIVPAKDAPLSSRSARSGVVMRRIRSRVVSRVNVLLIAAFCAGSVLAGEEPVETVFEWLTLPRAISSLEYTGEHVYEDEHPGLGRAWNYQRAGGLTLTIYVYDEGEAGVPDGADSSRVGAAYEKSKYEILNTRRDVKVELLNEGRIQIGSDDALPVREAVFDMAHKRERGKSYLWLTAIHGQMVKVRFSVFGPGLEEEQLTRGEILRALSTAITRDSSVAAARHEPKTEVAAENEGSTKRDYTILLSSDIPQGELPFWIAYVAGRAAWRAENNIADEPAGEPLAPLFEETVGAYQMAFGMTGESKSLRLRRKSPLADTQRAVRAGYLQEYVWTYLRDETWSEPAGLRLQEFDAWRTKNLKNHRPVTYGSISKQAENASESPALLPPR